MSSLNEHQQGHVDSLNQMKRSDLCPCGWYSDSECMRSCSTGIRANPTMLVRRIQDIYKQIDKDAQERTQTFETMLSERDDLIEKLRVQTDRLNIAQVRNDLQALNAEAALDDLAEILRLKRQVEAGDIKLKGAIDTAQQAIDVIASVQDYKQPDDPYDENALTMCEHEVFDFDVQSARAFLTNMENEL